MFKTNLVSHVKAGYTIWFCKSCAACGDENCRTVELDATVYETVPQALILAAGLEAAEKFR